MDKFKRKRHHDVDNSLIQSFEQEAKRRRQGHGELPSDNVGVKRAGESFSSLRGNASQASKLFLHCHLNMLKSLYASTEHVKPGGANDNAERSDDDEMWKQLDFFLHRRKHLIARNVEANKLRELLQNTKAISEKKTRKYPPKTTVTPKKNSATSLSFITQSQQLHSLSLNSPSKHSIKQEIFTYSPFAFQSNFHDQGKFWNPKQNQKTNTTINSMNLVFCLLEKRYTAALELAKEERDPFLPLIGKIESKIQDLMYQRTVVEKERRRGVTMEKGARVSDIEMQLKEMVENGFRTGEDYKVVESLASIDARLSLWNALTVSLSSALKPIM